MTSLSIIDSDCLITTVSGVLRVIFPTIDPRSLSQICVAESKSDFVTLSLIFFPYWYLQKYLHRWDSPYAFCSSLARAALQHADDPWISSFSCPRFVLVIIPLMLTFLYFLWLIFLGYIQVIFRNKTTVFLKYSYNLTLFFLSFIFYLWYIGISCWHIIVQLSLSSNDFHRFDSVWIDRTEMKFCSSSEG